MGIVKKEAIMFGLGKKKEDSQEDSQAVSETTVEDNSNGGSSGGSDKGLMIEGPNTKRVEEIPPLTHKEMKALKRSRYEEVRHRFNTAYVIKNIKTGQVAEIRAASPVHAANLIGWRPNKVKVLEQKVSEEVLKQSPEDVKKRTAEPVIEKEVKRNKQPETIATTPIENCPGLQ